MEKGAALSERVRSTDQDYAERYLFYLDKILDKLTVDRGLSVQEALQPATGIASQLVNLAHRQESIE